MEAIGGSGYSQATLLLGSQARTVTTLTAIQNAPYARGVLLVFKVASGGPISIDLTVRTSSPDAAFFVAAATVVATGNYSYLIYPGAVITGSAITQAVSLPMPALWLCNMVHNNANPITYTLDAHILR